MSQVYIYVYGVRKGRATKTRTRSPKHRTLRIPKTVNRTPLHLKIQSHNPQPTVVSLEVSPDSDVATINSYVLYTPMSLNTDTPYRALTSSLISLGNLIKPIQECLHRPVNRP